MMENRDCSGDQGHPGLCSCGLHYGAVYKKFPDLQQAIETFNSGLPHQREQVHHSVLTKARWRQVFPNSFTIKVMVINR